MRSLASLPLVALLCGSLVSTSAGCSFLFVEAPPPTEMRVDNTFSCSESRFWPVIDTVWAGINGLSAVVAASQSEQEFEMNFPDSGSRNTNIAGGLLWLALSGASAYYGYSKTASCRAAKAEPPVLLTRPAPDGTPPPLPFRDDDGNAPPPAPAPAAGAPAPLPPPQPDAAPAAPTAPTPAPAPAPATAPAPAPAAAPGATSAPTASLSMR